MLGELDAPEHSQFTRIAAKLYDTLERAAQRAGSRKKLKPSRVRLEAIGWGEAEVSSLEAICGCLPQVVPLAHPKTRAVLVLYTDASQDHWGAILTQLEPGGLALPLGEQKHRPLAFLSCRFAGIPSLWPMIKKEAFAIVKVTRRHDYLLLRPKGFRLYTGHRNLDYMFSPFTADRAMARYRANKLQCCLWLLNTLLTTCLGKPMPGKIYSVAGVLAHHYKSLYVPRDWL